VGSKRPCWAEVFFIAADGLAGRGGKSRGRFEFVWFRF